MPFVDRLYRPVDPATIQAAVPYGINDEGSEHDTPSFGETLNANFRINNTVVSAIQSKRFGTSAAAAPIDPNFNPWDHIKGTDFEDDWPSFVDARNLTDLENIRQDVIAERQARDVISRSSLGANILTGGLAGLADPLILAPGTIAVRGPKVGYSVIKTALMTGALSAGVATVQEQMLHASQQTRTFDESATNAFAAGVVGTFLGGVFAKVLTSAERNAIGRRMIDDLAAGPDANPNAAAMADALTKVERLRLPQPGGAAVVKAPSIDDLELEGSAAKALERIAPFSPIARTFFRKSAIARDVMFRLAETSPVLRGATSGETPGVAAENFINLWTNGTMARVLKQHGDVYSNYRKEGGQFTRSEFNEAVAMAMRRGDRSNAPLVSQSAKLWREQIIKPLTDRAIKAGLLPEDVHPTTAESYFSRVWNRKRLTAEEPQFKATVKQYYRSVVGRSSDAELEAYADDIADSVFDKLTGRGGEFGFDFQKITVSARGPLKERTFNIPDDVIERWLDSDVERVMHRFTRIIAADVEIADKFPESIDQATKRVTLNGPLQKVREDYKKLRDEVEADPELTPEQKQRERKRLTNDEKGAIKDIEGVRDILRGTISQNLENSPYARTLRVGQQFNYVRMMGDVVKASLTDVVRPMMVHGMREYFSGVSKLMLDPQFRAIAKREAGFSATIGQRALDARMATWTDIVDPFLADTPIERFMGNAARVFTRATGISWWNDWNKLVSSAITENRLTKNIVKDWDRLPEKERRYMAHLGIDREMAERMRGQIHKSSGGQVTFKTAKGSSYAVHPSGATTRNKAFRPEHGAAEQGPQPESQRTFYVTDDEADALSLFQTQGEPKAIEQHSSGQFGVKYLSGKDAGKFERRTLVTPKTEPEVGLTPVEIWNDGKKVHFGNKITQVERGAGNPRDEDGFWHSGTDDWSDDLAKRTFWGAINKDVNSTIVTPGAGDLPLWFRSPTGRMLGQFKSYVIASHQKALVRAVQDARHGNGVGVLSGMITMAAIGMAISWLTAIETNHVDDISENPGTWLAEGIDRSGMFSLLMEVNNSFERYVPGVGLYGLMESPFDEQGTGGASRFGFRAPSSIIAGPMGTTVDDFARIYGDPKKVITLMPGRTLPYVRPFLEWGVRPELSAQE